MPKLPEPLPFLKGITPYQSTSNKVETEGFAHRLCYNESPFGPSPKALTAMRDNLGVAHHYPDDMGYGRLREKLARHYGLDASRLICGDGSDELIGILVNSFIKQGDEAVISQYAFSLYEVAMRSVGGVSILVPENDLRMDLDAMLKAVTPKTRVVFIANPNNPTGDCLPRKDIETFLRNLRRIRCRLC
jgi:histidinol-phosphate aminotransferase